MAIHVLAGECQPRSLLTLGRERTMGSHEGPQRREGRKLIFTPDPPKNCLRPPFPKSESGRASRSAVDLRSARTLVKGGWIGLRKRDVSHEGCVWVPHRGVPSLCNPSNPPGASSPTPDLRVHRVTIHHIRASFANGTSWTKSLHQVRVAMHHGLWNRESMWLRAKSYLRYFSSGLEADAPRVCHTLSLCRTPVSYPCAIPQCNNYPPPCAPYPFPEYGTSTLCGGTSLKAARGHLPRRRPPWTRPARPRRSSAWRRRLSPGAGSGARLVPACPPVRPPVASVCLRLSRVCVGMRAEV